VKRVAEHSAFTLRGGRVVHAIGVRRDDVHVTGRRFSAWAAARSVTLDLDDHLIFPGFINAHDHLHLNSLPPLRDLGVFPNAYRWMEAAQARRAGTAMKAAENVATEIRLWHGALKNLLSGVTTVVHHDPWHVLFERANFPVRVSAGQGWCHSLGLSGASDASTLRYGPALHASRECVSPTRRWFIHLAEGTDAIAADELSQLDALGGLDERTVLVHATGLHAFDIARVKKAGAWVVWCPASNRALLGRTLDPRPFASTGRLALGTDSRLSGSRDLLAELRAAADVSGLDAPALLRLVTHDAARVIGRPDVGTIAPGLSADLVVIASRGGDPYETLLSSTRADIALVMRNGQPLIADDRFRSVLAAHYRDIVNVCVDGRLKCCPRRLLGPAAASALEPGFEVLAS
jgi:cytosine/adenosine deaminase-related metal-dependent hydrolase